MTYLELILLEPRIAAVLDKLTPDLSERERYAQYAAAKCKLTGLVGFGASVPDLTTPAAYDCAIQEAARRLRI